MIMTNPRAPTKRDLLSGGSLTARKLRTESARPSAMDTRAALPTFSWRESRPNAKKPMKQKNPNPIRKISLTSSTKTSQNFVTYD
jgi:hypothetical protein